MDYDCPIIKKTYQETYTATIEIFGKRIEVKGIQIPVWKKDKEDIMIDAILSQLKDNKWFREQLKNNLKYE